MKMSGNTCFLHLAFLLLFPVSIHAALIDQGDGTILDTDRNIYWLSNANLAGTETFGLSGIQGYGSMTWDKANEYIAAMNIHDSGNGWLGFNDWRLPALSNPDGTCTDDAAGTAPSSDRHGYNCTGSEYGHLFYDELQGDAGTSIATSGSATELAKFSNIKEFNYWTGTTFFNASFPAVDFAWELQFQNGLQQPNLQSLNNFVWAVRDATVVPLPSAIWLFGSGLLGLVGIARRKKVT